MLFFIVSKLIMDRNDEARFRYLIFFVHLMNNVMHHIALYNKVTSRKIATFFGFNIDFQ